MEVEEFGSFSLPRLSKLLIILRFYKIIRTILLIQARWYWELQMKDDQSTLSVLLMKKKII